MTRCAYRTCKPLRENFAAASSPLTWDASRHRGIGPAGSVITCARAHHPGSRRVGLGAPVAFATGDALREAPPNYEPAPASSAGRYSRLRAGGSGSARARPDTRRRCRAALGRRKGDALVDTYETYRFLYRPLSLLSLNKRAIAAIVSSRLIALRSSLITAAGGLNRRMTDRNPWTVYICGKSFLRRYSR